MGLRLPHQHSLRCDRHQLSRPPSFRHRVLQNYWSLAVEEQFYIVYPTHLPRRRESSVAAVVAARLAIVLGRGDSRLLRGFGHSDTRAIRRRRYFSPLPRAWELALGGAGRRRHGQLFAGLPTPSAALVSWVGLGRDTGGGLSSSRRRPPTPVGRWPSRSSGTALVIAGGVAKPASGWRACSGCGPSSLSGLISYSLYLWHWPMLDDRRAAQSNRHEPARVRTTLCGCSCPWAGDAHLLLLENPIRHSRFLITKRWASLVLGGCLIASSLILATVGIHLHDSGRPGDARPGQPPDERSMPSSDTPGAHRADGDGSTASHRIVARVLLDRGLDCVHHAAGARGRRRSGWGPDRKRRGHRMRRGQRRDRAPDRQWHEREQHVTDVPEPSLRRRGTGTSVRASERRAVGEHMGAQLASVVGSGADRKVLAPGSPQWYATLRERMQQRVRQLTASGATVFLLTQPPFVDLGKPAGPTSQDKDFERLNAFLSEFAAHTPHVKLLDLSTLVCPSGPPCPMGVDGLDLRGDGEHYTGEGSLFVARWLMPQLGIEALHNPDNTLPVMKMVDPVNGRIAQGNTGNRHRRILQRRSDQGRVPSHGQCAAQRGHRNRIRHTWLLGSALEHDERTQRHLHSTKRRVRCRRQHEHEQRHHRARQELTGAVTQICSRALATSRGWRVDVVITDVACPETAFAPSCSLQPESQKSGQEAEAYPGSCP